MSYRLSVAEIAFLDKYCTVIKPVVKPLKDLQSETNTVGVAPASDLPAPSKI